MISLMSFVKTLLYIYFRFFELVELLMHSIVLNKLALLSLSVIFTNTIIDCKIANPQQDISHRGLLFQHITSDNL